MKAYLATITALTVGLYWLLCAAQNVAKSENAAAVGRQEAAVNEISL